MTNTIYALSTLYGKSAIAVIRVSGDSALNSLVALTKNKTLTPRLATLCNLYDDSNNIVDKAVVIYFPKNNSYSGEHLVEYHIHGSTAVINEMLNLLSKCHNHRMAEKGEFSKQALLNNKLNLLEVESVLDLIEAETSIQREQALRGLGGDINKKYDFWYQELLEALALLESTIDFSDQDIPDNLFDLIDSKVKNILNAINVEIEKSLKSKIHKIREGFSVAIIGAPNVGKSSLINYLSNKDVAIVSSIAGTTRDIIEVFLDIEGFAVSLFDSAGIRIAQDEIESIGIKKALLKANDADIKIVMIDATNLETYDVIKNHIDENTFVLCNKIDMVEQAPKIDLPNLHFVSVEKNIGLIEFKTSLAKKLYNISGIKDSPMILNQRHKDILLSCSKSLNNYFTTTDELTLRAFYLREAINSFSMLFGKVDVENMLGIIFNKFCIGK